MNCLPVFKKVVYEWRLKQNKVYYLNSCFFIFLPTDVQLRSSCCTQRWRLNQSDRSFTAAGFACSFLCLYSFPTPNSTLNEFLPQNIESHSRYLGVMCAFFNNKSSLFWGSISQHIKFQYQHNKGQTIIIFNSIQYKCFLLCSFPFLSRTLAWAP